MSKNILKHLFSGTIIIMIFVTPFLLQAVDTTTNNPDTTTNNPSSGPIVIINPFNCGGQANCTIPDLIKAIVDKILIPIGGVVAVLMIMWAGFLYVTAGGNPAQISKAHQALLWAVIGAAILLGAWVISQTIGATIDQLKKT
jgi:hypothetical protein